MPNSLLERPAALRVGPMRPEDARAWSDYVMAHPEATVFHRLQWSRAVEEAYGHEPMHLMAWREGRVAGVLPLFLVKSALVGRVAVSVPYATYGGIVADSTEVARALLDAARDLCHQANGRYLELRHRGAMDLDLPVIDRYVTFRKALPSRSEEVLSFLPRKARASARNGLKSLESGAVSFARENLPAIFDLYARTMRRLGSPNYRWSFFASLARQYGDDCVCLLVRRRGEPMAGVVSFVFRDEIVPYFSGSTREGMACNANNVMYLRLMEYAVERGLKGFDFNRTRRDNSGPYQFKVNHGFEPQPLHYQICMVDGREMPNLTPSNRKFALAGRAWRHLPLWMTRPAGEMVSRWIP